MKQIVTYLTLFLCVSTYAQDYCFVNAENGLNVRAQPKLVSEKIAKLPYGVVVKMISNTNVELITEDNGKQLIGHWVKVKYDNYTYLVSKEAESFEVEGYVFDAYLKNAKQDNSISITNIDKIRFEELFKVATKKVHKPKKITNLDSIKTVLKGRVEWVTTFDENNTPIINTIKSIVPNNGQKLFINQKSNDFGFYEETSAYYPNEDILVLEGGHASDVSFCINTGETATAGNPEYIIASPKNTYRLNGSFGGQECVSYFIQKKVSGKFIYLTELSSEYDLCTFKEFYWINETTFIYSKIGYQNDSVNGQVEYFTGEINNKT